MKDHKRQPEDPEEIQKTKGYVKSWSHNYLPKRLSQKNLQNKLAEIFYQND